MSIRVKVCGITRVEDALTAIRLGANAIGFIFWDKSARYIDPNEARKIVMALPPFVSVVGVYVDPSSEWVEETCSIAGLNLLQFHGDELPEFCSQFPLPYIKAVRIRSGIDLLQYATQYSSSNGLLLDSYVEGVPGGTGRTFEWSLIPENLSLPLILSGGLHPENVCAAIRKAKPWAVDVSSGVEITKGIKDADKIAAFMTGVRDGEKL
jgi:phosphoribosylanthranilate isomerase|tara:strand:+ start:1045 stop:1671 length:627 start_codon:yes stop_codon:yes gene_type:complete